MRLTFTPSGPTVLCEPLLIRDDDNLEGTEVVTVSVSSAQVGIGDRSSVIIQILDNDGKEEHILTSTLLLLWIAL